MIICGGRFFVIYNVFILGFDLCSSSLYSWLVVCTNLLGRPSNEIGLFPRLCAGLQNRKGFVQGLSGNGMLSMVVVHYFLSSCNWYGFDVL